MNGGFVELTNGTTIQDGPGLITLNGAAVEFNGY